MKENIFRWCKIALIPLVFLNQDNLHSHIQSDMTLMVCFFFHFCSNLVTTLPTFVQSDPIKVGGCHARIVDLKSGHQWDTILRIYTNVIWDHFHS